MYFSKPKIFKLSYISCQKTCMKLICSVSFIIPSMKGGIYTLNFCLEMLPFYLKNVNPIQLIQMLSYLHKIFKTQPNYYNQIKHYGTHNSKSFQTIQQWRTCAQ